MAGMQIFEANGTFTPVVGTTYKIICIGGGQGGTNVSGSTTAAAGRAGVIKPCILTATADTPIPVTVGAGGAVGVNIGSQGGAGGTSSFGAYVSAAGGSNSGGGDPSGTGFGIGNGGGGQNGGDGYGAGGGVNGQGASGAVIVCW
jgi:hypothetical protein